jgi:copper transport protein
MAGAALSSRVPAKSEVDTEPIAETAALAGPVDLDEFLDTESMDVAWSSLLGGVARIVGLLGVVGAVGGLVFVAGVLRGDRSDIQAVLSWVRLAGGMVVVGAVAQAAAKTAMLSGGWSGVWSGSAIGNALWSSFGAAVGLRLVGGALIASAARLRTPAATVAGGSVVAVKQLAHAGTGPHVPSGHADAGAGDGVGFIDDGDRAWRTGSSPAVMVGIAFLVLSFVFDGHTVSEGPRWLHAVVNPVHVAAGATWAGGVVMLASVIGRRSRRGAESGAGQLAARFSVVAAVALVAVAAAGIALAVIILDTVSQIWSTPWGRLLAFKVVLVVMAAAAGGYNHRVMVPELERGPKDRKLTHRFRTIVTFEAIVLVAITVVTAMLIGASTA